MDHRLGSPRTRLLRRAGLRRRNLTRQPERRKSNFAIVGAPAATFGHRGLCGATPGSTDLRPPRVLSSRSRTTPPPPKRSSSHKVPTCTPSAKPLAKPLSCTWPALYSAAPHPLGPALASPLLLNRALGAL